MKVGREAWAVDRYSVRGWVGFAIVLALIGLIGTVTEFPVLMFAFVGAAVCAIQAYRARGLRLW